MSMLSASATVLCGVPSAIPAASGLRSRKTPSGNALTSVSETPLARHHRIHLHDRGARERISTSEKPPPFFWISRAFFTAFFALLMFFMSHSATRSM